MRRLFGKRPSGPCLYLLTALAAAFFLLPAVSASAANKHASVEIVGSGSGRVFGEGPLNGNPPLNCHKPSQGGDVCDTEMNKFEGLVGQLFVEEAAPGSKFVKWEAIEGEPVGCEEVTNPECGVLSFGTPVKVTAEFEISGPPPVKLNLSTSGSGSGSFKCDTGSGEEACKGEYPEGTKVKVITKAATGSEFVKWTGDCSGSGICEVMMNAEHSVGAEFTLESESLTINETGTGTGEVKCKFNGGSAGACASPQPFGTSVEVIATPHAGSELVTVSGTGSASACSSSPCTFTIKAPSSVTVEFKLEPVITKFPLTVVLTGHGTVESTSPTGLSCSSPAEECTKEFAEGTVSLKATAGSGYTLAGWLGCKHTGAGTCQVNLTSATEVTAVFLAQAEAPSVTVTEFSGAQHGCTNGGLDVDVNGSHTYVCNGKNGAPGETPTITPFSGNQHGCSEGGLEITVNSTHTYVCNGKNGTNGTNGSNGATGAQGAQGPAGANGKDGAQGPAGPQGATGPQGPAGKVKVTCKVEGSKVQCTVTQQKSKKRHQLRWRLMRGGHAYSHGTARGSLHLDLSHLRPGRYVLRVQGERGGTPIVVG